MSVSDNTQALPQCYGLYQELSPFDTGPRPFPHHYLLYASTGSFHLELEQARWLLPPERAAWIACGVPVRISCTAPVTCCSVIFAPTFLQVPVPECRVFSVSRLARELITYVMRWDRSHDGGPATERCFRVLADVGLELAAAPDHFWLPRGESAVLQAALSYTLEHLGDRPSFQQVAQAASVSERTLARRFETEIRMTWRQFVQRARLIRATEGLAEQGLSVLEVALNTGYESISAFNSAFRSVMGETPTQYRRRLSTNGPQRAQA